MNKVILMGRLVRDPEAKKIEGTEPLTVTRYTLACSKRFKKQGEQDADFIGCVAFGKAGEFAEKYFKKGQMVSVVGRLQVKSYEKEGVKHWSTDVVIEEQYFAESKASFESNRGTAPTQAQSGGNDGFYPINESVEDDDLPF